MGSLIAQRHFKTSNKASSKTLERLSSGKRINRAADDAAGLAISENLRADIRSLEQARRNTNDAIGMVQVAEGALDEINNIMIRLRELSVQAASDTIGNTERDYLNREFFSLKYEIDRIALSTEFNGTRLIAGNDRTPESLFEGSNPFPLEVQVDKDWFEDVDSLERPNPMDIIRIPFHKMNARLEGEGSLNLGDPENEEGLRIDNKQSAQRAINQIDVSQGKVASFRATLGAVQNRLTSADNTLGIRIENLSVSKSRILDADFAKETADFAQWNILRQAGAAVLAQAKQTPEVALQLLQA
jgi:flagellin